MSRNSEYAVLVERLRADLMKAEEEFRQATTPDSKKLAHQRFEKALNLYSTLVLTGRIPSE